MQSIIPSSHSEEIPEEGKISDTEVSFAVKMVQTNTAAIQDVTVTKQKTEQVEPVETKTTFETIQDVLAHPIIAISEKMQSAISTSSGEHAEQVSSAASEQTESSEKESSLAAAVSSLETTMLKREYCCLQDASKIEEQPVDSVPSETVKATESKTTFESLRDAITHPIATITEKIQSVISSSTSEEVPSAEKEVG